MTKLSIANRNIGPKVGDFALHQLIGHLGLDQTILRVIFHFNMVFWNIWGSA